VSETREIRRVEEISTYWPFDATISKPQDTGDLDNNYNFYTSGTEVPSWAIVGSYVYTSNQTNAQTGGPGVYTITPSNPKTQKLILTLDPDTLRISDSVTGYNISASRCTVQYDLEVQSTFRWETDHPTVVVSKDSTLTWAYNGSAIIGPDDDQTINTSNPFTLTTSGQVLRFNDNNVTDGLPRFYDIGSDASYFGTSGATNWPMTLTLQIEQDPIPGENSRAYDARIQVYGTVRRFWEGNYIQIDGLDGDTLPAFTTTSTMTVDASVDKNASAQLDTNFSITEDSFAKVSADSAIDSTSTFSIIPSFIIDPTRTLINEFHLQTTTANFAFADASISSNTDISITPLLLLGADSAISANNTASFVGNLIYDIGGEYSWDNISQTSDYQWDDRDSWTDWTDNTWGEELLTWDDWYLNTWDRPFSVFNIFTTEETPTFKPGGIFANTASFDISENVAFKEPAEFSTTANFGTSFTARGIIDQGSSIQANFSTDYLANIVYDGIANFDGVLTAEIIANTIFELISTPPAQFSTTIVPTKKLIGDTNMAVAFEILEKLGNIIYDAQSEMDAFNAQIVAGSLFTQTDPYNIAKVLEETRQFLINIETRQHLINGENRLNTIKAESRNILVPEETRKYKLKVAPMTNRFSTPKVRSKQ